MPMNFAELDRRISKLRKRLEVLESLRQAAVDDPELFQLLVAEEREPQVTNGQTPERSRRGTGKSHATKTAVVGGPAAREHFDKIARFLESTGGEPRTVAEIGKAVGLNRSHIVQAIYRTHLGFFDSVPIEGHKTRKAFKLKPGWRELLQKHE